MRIIDHDNPIYREQWQKKGRDKYNGAYYYSREIVEKIIPKIRTDRDWVTINNYTDCYNGAIVFIHNNKNPENYRWLEKYDDLILVCGVKETMDKVKHLGKPIYLPLSVDVSYVEMFRAPKKREVAYVGRTEKTRGTSLPTGVYCIGGIGRGALLKEMAKCRKVYAVGRTAIEAKILGCKVLAYDPRYPDPSIWKVLDCAEAAKILQRELDKIDGV